MTVLHINMFVERMFSTVNLIKTKTRSCLEVDSVSSFLKIKSYLNSPENLFEPEDIHFTLYTPVFMNWYFYRLTLMKQVESICQGNKVEICFIFACLIIL